MNKDLPDFTDPGQCTGTGTSRQKPVRRAGMQVDKKRFTGVGSLLTPGGAFYIPVTAVGSALQMGIQCLLISLANSEVFF